MVAILMLGMCLRQISGSKLKDFKKCGTRCMDMCTPLYIGVVHGALCPPQCVTWCITHSNDRNEDRLSYYCNLGCASQNSVNISTLQDPCGEEVEKYVNSCSLFLRKKVEIY
ncbi:hypothetical protein MKW98_011338 [Papaver atlanticum]|uniref:Uncharacterized protein n=1 Tax=Papaver atlanticum TaxID=357466 RepID=A0AAD4STZ1_9MAGN|nr:hypothetical protein MKW98_011338 [Papaver atlanticum]